MQSKNQYEFELVFDIRYLQSVKYNLNVFGKFNPIIVDEQQIIDKMKS